MRLALTWAIGLITEMAEGSGVVNAPGFYLGHWTDNGNGRGCGVVHKAKALTADPPPSTSGGKRK